MLLCRQSDVDALEQANQQNILALILLKIRKKNPHGVGCRRNADVDMGKAAPFYPLGCSNYIIQENHMQKLMSFATSDPKQI